MIQVGLANVKKNIFIYKNKNKNKANLLMTMWKEWVRK